MILVFHGKKQLNYSWTIFCQIGHCALYRLWPRYSFSIKGNVDTLFLTQSISLQTKMKNITVTLAVSILICLSSIFNFAHGLSETEDFRDSLVRRGMRPNIFLKKNVKTFSYDLISHPLGICWFSVEFQILAPP